MGSSGRRTIEKVYASVVALPPPRLSPGMPGMPPAPPIAVNVCVAVTFTLRVNAENLSMYDREASTVARRPPAVNSWMPPVNIRVTSTTAALSLPYASTFRAAMIG